MDGLQTDQKSSESGRALGAASSMLSARLGRFAKWMLPDGWRWVSTGAIALPG
ncbi:hypothetical protein [Thermoleptolyngbya sp. M55_K2018_002]|uniref:hypothetical protein n=1 Tax=Thermoleptolyngbya sp. M55_K2018_002 TaxID=2747808 RepID=UPI0019DBC2E1|nr:hypothetical protein [Thermoleptolyngbya sp. M55_K2018_002]HIK41237.1 hypothetical protein [Thermoleptolyngbya sp. M55_K2018_002]